MRVPRATLLALTRQPDPQPVDPGYWLARCDGFEVWGPNGRLGLVAEIVQRPPQGTAELLVLCGMFRRRTVVIPASAVRMIEPDKLRVTLSYDATVADVVDARRPRA
jgi:hypothetical protein